MAEGLEKSFFGVTVLRGVGLTLRPGEVHGLVGENGAGKSTFMKILAGVYERDAGTITLGGSEVHFTHPVQAARAGLATVFQEFNLLPERTVAQNVFLGREPKRGGLRRPQGHGPRDAGAARRSSASRASTRMPRCAPSPSPSSRSSRS